MNIEEDLFKSFMRFLPGIVFLKDAEGRFLFINGKAVEVFNRSREEWIGKTDEDLWPPHVAERLRANDRIVLREDRPLQFVEALDSDGESCFWLANKFPVILNELGEKAVGGVAIDVTRRVRLEQALLDVRNELATRVDSCSENLREANRRLTEELEERIQAQHAVDQERDRLLSILEHLPVLILLKDSDYRIRFANEVVRREFNVDDGSLCYEVLRGEDEPCDDCPTDSSAGEGGPSKRECRFKNGRIYEIYDFPFRDTNDTDLILELGIDITERQSAEGALRESERKLRRLASEILVAQELERKRLSQEVHDDLGQSLLFLKLMMGELKREVPENLKTLQSSCQEMLGHMDDVIDRIRRLSRSLSPSVLEDLGLTAALRHLVDEFCRHFRVECCSIAIDNVEGLFSAQVQTHVYRIFQEALTNIGKHADATCVTVEVKLQEDRASLIIIDNGRGFDLEIKIRHEEEGRGLGLPTIEERVKFVGGVLDIQSNPGEGTRLTISVPVDREL